MTMTDYLPNICSEGWALPSFPPSGGSPTAPVEVAENGQVKGRVHFTP
jgi:hypothetical protein